LLILLSFVSFATSQNKFNITAYNSQLQDIFNGLVDTEKKIGKFVSNLSDFVGEINGNLKSNKSRLYLDLSHLQLVLQLQGSINNHDVYQQVSGCGNVASKISEIDVDLKKFPDFVKRLQQNMTELYSRNLHVTYDLIMDNVPQQDIVDIIYAVNEAMVQNLYYILQLQTNIRYEKSISTNLKLFLKHFCECEESVYGVSQNTNTRAPLREMEATVIARQASVIDAVNETLIESQKLIKSKNVTKDMMIASSMLIDFCQKMKRIDDYSNVTVPYTNTCSDLTKVQDFMTYRRFRYTQVLSFVMTNSSVLAFYRNMITASISNATSDLSILSAVNNLETELMGYTDDLALQLSYLTLFASSMRRNALIMKLFCGCRVPEPKTTTELQTTTQRVSTSRKVFFSTAKFLSTTNNSYEGTGNSAATTRKSSMKPTTQKSSTNLTTSASISTTSKDLATTPGSSASTPGSSTTTPGSSTTTPGSSTTTPGSSAIARGSTTTPGKSTFITRSSTTFMTGSSVAPPGSSASTSVNQSKTMFGSSTTSSKSSILTTKSSTVSESSTKSANSTSSGPTTVPTTSEFTKLSTSSPKIPPTLPTISTASTTTNVPFSPPICSFTKTLVDLNGTYIKSACLVETASNGSNANSTCQANSMQLMTIDSNMTQTALSIFVQETLSEGTFWVSSGNGTDMCNFVAVNGTGLVINQARCSWFTYYSICEYKDPNVPKRISFSPNLDACGLTFPVQNDAGKEYTRYACIMGYTRSYVDSSYACMLNGMQMFNVIPKSVMLTVNEFLVSFYGNNSGIFMWVNGPVDAGSCSFLDGNQVPIAVAGGSCDQQFWSICETPYDGSY
jgi:hypothetical protein